MNEITDIWFLTNLKLEDLADQLELEEIEYDYENMFEWVTGKFGKHDLNISRAHEDFVEKTKETTVFLQYNYPPKKKFSEDLVQKLVSKLKTVNISPIYLGEKTIGDRDENIVINLVEKIT